MPDAAGTLTARSPWSRGASSLTGLTGGGGRVCNAERVPRVRETTEHGQPSAPRAERAVAAIFLRFVRTGTTHSGDGNGCGHGRWSLSFHALQLEETSKGRSGRRGPRATAVPVPRAQGCLLRHGPLELRPLGTMRSGQLRCKSSASEVVRGPGRPAPARLPSGSFPEIRFARTVCSCARTVGCGPWHSPAARRGPHPATDTRAALPHFSASVLPTCTAASAERGGRRSAPLCDNKHRVVALPPSSHKKPSAGELLCSYLKFFQEVSLPLTLDPSILTR